MKRDLHDEIIINEWENVSTEYGWGKRIGCVTVNHPRDDYGQGMDGAKINWSTWGATTIEEVEFMIICFQLAIEKAKELNKKYGIPDPVEVIEIKIRH